MKSDKNKSSGQNKAVYTEVSERLTALYALLDVLQAHKPLSAVFQATKLSPFAKTLCFGVCRQYVRLEWIADQLVQKRMKPKDFDVWLCLLLGLYQLYDLSSQEYAVVKETVALLDALKKTWAKGFVNAVLRQFCRERDSIITSLKTESAFVTGHPAWFMKQLKRDWPKEYLDIVRENDKHPPMSLRVNTRLVSREDYLSALHDLGIQAVAHPYATECIVLSTPVHVEELPQFSQGMISVQDAAAQLAAALLDLQPGLRVLDACAAPGGKTCHMLEKEPYLQEMVALDIDHSRLLKIRDNLQRLHLNASLIAGDASQPNTWWQGELFDRILLDAPCSATGVIRRHPDIKLLRSASDITAVSQTQYTLLCALWPLLAPGGLLLYATCSIMREENEQTMVRFLQETSDASLCDMPGNWGHAVKAGRQILPGEDHMDGFYYCLLRKTEMPSC